MSWTCTGYLGPAHCPTTYRALTTRVCTCMTHHYSCWPKRANGRPHFSIDVTSRGFCHELQYCLAFETRKINCRLSFTYLHGSAYKRRYFWPTPAPVTVGFSAPSHQAHQGTVPTFGVFWHISPAYHPSLAPTARGDLQSTATQCTHALVVCQPIPPPHAPANPTTLGPEPIPPT